jgi:hypothetical protein
VSSVSFSFSGISDAAESGICISQAGFLGNSGVSQNLGRTAKCCGQPASHAVMLKVDFGWTRGTEV